MSEQPLLNQTAAAVLSLERETGFAPNGIVSRTLLRTDNGRVVLFGFAEEQELTEHTTTQYATVQILSGECEFDLADQTHLLKAGDFVYMPPGLPHAVRATKQFSMLLTLFKPGIQAEGDIDATTNGHEGTPIGTREGLVSGSGAIHQQKHAFSQDQVGTSMPRNTSA